MTTTPSHQDDAARYGRQQSPASNPRRQRRLDAFRSVHNLRARNRLDVDAALAELREITDGHGDLLAERAEVITGFRGETRETAGGHTGAALCIAAGAGLAKLTRWIDVG
jgi:hypothetical protein